MRPANTDRATGCLPKEGPIKHIVVLAVVAAACTATTPTTTTAPPRATTTTVPATTTTQLEAVDFASAVDAASLPGRILVADDVTYVTDPTGESRVEISDAAGTSQATWSPDGSTVAFSAFADEAPVVGFARPGEDASFVSAPFLPFYFHWSPSGLHLAFLGNGTSGFVELGIVDAEASTATAVDVGTPYYFDWSPDGSRIFSHAGVGDTRLVTPDGAVENVDDNAGFYQAPQWTPAGVIQLITVPATISAQGLRFARQDTDQAIVVGPPAGEFERIVPIEAAAAFDSNGRDLAFTDSSNPTPIIRGSLQVVVDNDIIALTDEPVIAFEWSPDGTRLLFLEVAGDGTAPEARWVVWERGASVTFAPFTPSLASLNTYFPFWDQYARSLTLWSPDGKAFVYSALDTVTGETSVFVQPVESGAPARELGPGDWASWSR